MTRILEVPDVAEALHVSIPTVHRLVSSGKIASFKVNRRRLFPDWAIDRYVEANLEELWRDGETARIPYINEHVTNAGSPPRG
jgi:excisionase family DNA binding protein